MKQHLWLSASLALVLSVAPTSSARAAEVIEPADPALGRPVEFYRDLFPILESKCLACHNRQTKEGSLILENVPSIVKGGGSGPSVVAGKPDESLIYKLVTRKDEPAMPPMPNKVQSKPLTPKEVGIFRKWIEEGAQPGTVAAPMSTVNWQPVPPSIKSVFCLALSPEERFVVAGRSNRVFVYDLTSGKEVAELTDPSLLSVASADGKPMYGPGTSHRDFVHAVAISPDGETIASSGYREIKLWQRVRDKAAPFAVGAPIQNIAIEADGTQAAFILNNNTVRLWNLVTSQGGATLTGHAAAVTGAQFSADGKTIYTVSDDKTIRSWNTENGQPVLNLETPQPIKGLSLSLDGKQLLTAHADKQIRVWGLEQLKPVADPPPAEPVKELKVIAAHPADITCMGPVPGKNEFYTGCQDTNARVWNIDNGGQVFGQSIGGVVLSVAVSEDRVAAAGANNIARVWRRDNQQVVAEVKGDPALDRRALELTEDQGVGKQQSTAADLAVKESEKDVTGREESLKKAMEAKPKAEMAVVEAEKKVVEAEAKVKAATEALAAKADDVNLQKAKTDAETALKKEVEARDRTKDGVVSADRGITLSQQGLENSKKQVEVRKQQFAAAQQKDMQFDQQVNAAKAAAAAAVGKPIKTVALSQDGKQLLTAGDDGVLQLWDAGTNNKPLDTLRGHQGAVVALARTPSGLIVSGSADQQALVWDLKPTWKLSAVLGAKPESPLDTSASPMVQRVLCLAFSPDGKRLVSGGGEPSRSGELLMWDVATKALIKTWPEPHSDTVFSVAFSRDGRFLATGAADKFVKVWEVDSAKLVRSYEGHTNHVLGVSWKADGATLASAGADNAIKIWNVETGEQRRTIANYEKQVTSLSFIGITDNICSCGGDKTVKFHRAGDGGNYRGFPGMTDFVYAVTATRNEGLVLAAGEDGSIRVWNGQNGQPVVTFEAPLPAGTTASTK